jgi:5-methylcytosine-specific restriction endonuclease McrA
VSPSAASGPLRSSPASGDVVAFAEKLLGLLDTGSFTTSYKYALLLALFDATVEETAADGSAPRVLRGRDLGRRVFELYWRQARPFSAAGPLRQSTQRDVVVKIAELRRRLGVAEHMTLDAARTTHPAEVGRLEHEVVATVVRYPIPLLQRFGVGGVAVEDRFVYDVGWAAGIAASRVHRGDFDDRVHLVGEAGDHLIAIAGLARPVIEREWLRHVARRNTDEVDELRLEAFLFGSQRQSLSAVRAPLLELQTGRCFYCDGERGPWEVDHFLPWARWPDDRLDNLVVTHRRCNNDKRAALPALGHLERWWGRMLPGESLDQQLDDLAVRLRWPRRPERTAGGARGLYLHQPAGAMLWAGPGRVEPLDPARVRVVLAPAALAAAERMGGYASDDAMGAMNPLERRAGGAERRAALDELYAAIDELRRRLGGARLAEANSRSGWPDRGVYLFFEPGEYREDGVTPRVTRVGTHGLTERSTTRLWTRLAQHRGSVGGANPGGGNHRASVFRFHVGTALIARDGWDEAAATWGRTAVGSSDNRADEAALERAVSRYIGSMPLLWLDVPDRGDRAALEAGLIALLSNADRDPVDPPSDGWLGHHADRRAIRRSGLWNVNHVDDQPDTAVVDRFRTHRLR